MESSLALAETALGWPNLHYIHFGDGFLKRMEGLVLCVESDIVVLYAV